MSALLLYYIYECNFTAISLYKNNILFVPHLMLIWKFSWKEIKDRRNQLWAEDK
jgi:hypothetical protein